MSGVPYHALATSAASTAPRSRSAELFVRWLQAAVFASHMRLHGIGEREPWAFGAEAEAIAQEVARVPLSAACRICSGRSAQRDADRHAGDARDAARVSRQRARARLRDAVHVRRRAAGGADRRARAAKSRSRCRPAHGTTSIRASAFAGQRVLRYRAALDQFPVFGREGMCCRSAARSSTPARSTPQRPLERCGCSARRRRRSRLRAGSIASEPTAQWLASTRRPASTSSCSATRGGAPSPGASDRSAPRGMMPRPPAHCDHRRRARGHRPGARCACSRRGIASGPFAARLVVIGDHRPARRDAPRASASPPRYVRLRPRGDRTGGRRRRESGTSRWRRR